MKDPFERARLAHRRATGGALGQATTAMVKPVGAPGRSPGPAAPSTGGEVPFTVLAKRFGVDRLKLDKNPVVARTQLLQHLAQKLGPEYMSHPGVTDLLNSFTSTKAERDVRKSRERTTATQKNVKSLMG